MATSRRTIATTFAGLVFASVVLAGCAAGGSTASSTSSPTPDGDANASGQTTAEACAILKDTMGDVYAGLQASMAQASEDPSAATDSVIDLADAFEATKPDVTNTDVRAIVDSSVTSLKDLGAQLDTYANDRASFDEAAATDAATAVQSSFTKLQATCA